MSFPKLRSQCHLLPIGPDRELSDEDLTRLICSDCPFYKEGRDEELECGAYLLLRHLLKTKVLTVEAIIDAVKE